MAGREIWSRKGELVRIQSLVFATPLPGQMSGDSYSIAELVEELVNDPKTIFIPDTCALLDIIRLVERADTAKQVLRTVEAIGNLTTSVSNNNSSILLIQTVRSEYDRNLDNVKDGVVRHLTNIEKKWPIAMQCLDLRGSILVCESFEKSLENLENELSNLLEVTCLLKDDSGAINRGFVRERSLSPPARRGENSADCVIFEHIIALAKALRNSGFGESICFITSNTVDYMIDGSLKPEIQMEVSKSKIDIVTNWQWAGSLIKPA